MKFEFFFQLRDLRFEFIDLGFRHLFHLGIGLVVKEVLGILQVRHGFLITMRTLEHTLQVVVVTVQTHITRLIGNNGRIGNEQAHFVKLRLQSFYSIEYVHAIKVLAAVVVPLYCVCVPTA